VSVATLSCTGLTVRYGSFTAVGDVSLEFRQGQVCSLIGPNGAGKTTFANALTGLRAPTSGRVFIHGEDVTRIGNTARARRGLGRSFQLINIFSAMTVYENLRLGAQAAAFGWQPFWKPISCDRATKQRADAMLEIIGLEHLRNRVAGTLSHGDQRALELGLTLVNEPRILVLDEPLAGVGHHGLTRAIDLLRRVAVGRTVVMIEHNMDAVMALSDEIAVLVAGRLLTKGTPTEIRNSLEVRRAYLGEGDPGDAVP
jgi:branched-chain amino acid transport system ATP-binding protein